MHFLILIYTACKSLAKWWWLFLGTAHFDLEGWRRCPPLDFVGERILPWNCKYLFKKIASLSILNGFEIYIHLWIGNDIYNFTKIAAIMNCLFCWNNPCKVAHLHFFLAIFARRQICPDVR